MRLGDKLWHNHNDNNDDHREDSYMYVYIWNVKWKKEEIKLSTNNDFNVERYL